MLLHQSARGIIVIGNLHISWINEEKLCNSFHLYLPVSVDGKMGEDWMQIEKIDLKKSRYTSIFR